MTEYKSIILSVCALKIITLLVFNYIIIKEYKLKSWLCDFVTWNRFVFEIEDF